MNVVQVQGIVVALKLMVIYVKTENYQKVYLYIFMVLCLI